MTKRVRQFLGILAALAAYYLVHEGAHLLFWCRVLPLYRASFSGEPAAPRGED